MPCSAFSQGDLEEGEVEEDDEGEQIDEDIGRGVSSNQMEVREDQNILALFLRLSSSPMGSFMNEVCLAPQEIPNEEGVRGNWRLLGWSWKLVAEQPYNRYITFSLEKRDVRLEHSEFLWNACSHALRDSHWGMQHFPFAGNDAGC